MKNLVFNIKITKNLTLSDNSTGTTSISYIWPHLFFKREFICRVFCPANTNKGQSPNPKVCHPLLVLLISYPNNDVTSSSTVPAAWKPQDLQIPIPSLCLFWGQCCTPCAPVTIPKAISISEGLIHEGHSHLAEPHIYNHYSNSQKPG